MGARRHAALVPLSGPSGRAARADGMEASEGVGRQLGSGLGSTLAGAIAAAAMRGRIGAGLWCAPSRRGKSCGITRPPHRERAQTAPGCATGLAPWRTAPAGTASALAPCAGASGMVPANGRGEFAMRTGPGAEWRAWCAPDARPLVRKPADIGRRATAERARPTQGGGSGAGGAFGEQCRQGRRRRPRHAPARSAQPRGRPGGVRNANAAAGCEIRTACDLAPPLPAPEIRRDRAAPRSRREKSAPRAAALPDTAAQPVQRSSATARLRLPHSGASRPR